MNRGNFFRILAAAGSFIFPLSSLAKYFKDRVKGFKIERGKDRFDKKLTLFDGDIFYCKVSTGDTNGGLYVFESTREKKGGPPLHYHFEQDEWFYILEGEFLFKIGEETFTARAGDSLFGPRLIPHAFSKINEGPARMIILYQPAGRMEAHFKGVSEGAYANLSEEERHQYQERNGFKVVGPALTSDKTRS